MCCKCARTVLRAFRDGSFLPCTSDSAVGDYLSSFARLWDPMRLYQCFRSTLSPVSLRFPSAISELLGRVFFRSLSGFSPRRLTDFSTSTRMHAHTYTQTLAIGQRLMLSCCRIFLLTSPSSFLLLHCTLFFLLFFLLGTPL